mmetsp:Transcript_21994/g.55215  ORF Transcript_21994/g.55215 Transcript_21994/m.55215 type:complete len:224 (-) Transcript_21994:893-1564(-)
MSFVGKYSLAFLRIFPTSGCRLTALSVEATRLMQVPFVDCERARAMPSDLRIAESGSSSPSGGPMHGPAPTGPFGGDTVGEWDGVVRSHGSGVRWRGDVGSDRLSVRLYTGGGRCGRSSLSLISWYSCATSAVIFSGATGRSAIHACSRRSRALGRSSGSFLRQHAMKAFISAGHASGESSVGGGLLAIAIIARTPGSSWCGGCPSATCITVIPRDQISVVTV